MKKMEIILLSFLLSNIYFSIFCSSGQKISLDRVKKYPGHRQVGLLFTVGQKYARVRAHLYGLIVFIRFPECFLNSLTCLILALAYPKMGGGAHGFKEKTNTNVLFHPTHPIKIRRSLPIVRLEKVCSLHHPSQ